MSAMAAQPSAGTALWKIVILALAMLVNVTLFYRLLWGGQSLLVYRDLRERQTELAADLDRHKALNASLSREILLLQSDDRYKERAVRQRLNFVRENEILYLFNDEQESPGAAANDGKN